MTISKIHKALRSEFGGRNYRITRDGNIEVWGIMPNTDQTGWYLYGYLDNPETEAMIAILSHARICAANQRRGENMHTPGPWELGPSQLGHVSCILKRGHGEICSGPYGNGEAQKAWSANARLIVAAPDLLEACKAIRDNWEHNLSEAMALVSVAIAKAEGRS